VIGSFVLLLVIMARGGDATMPDTSEPNSYSVSALGHKALVEFLEESGVSVSLRRSVSRIPIPENSVVIAAEPQREELDEDEGDYFEELKEKVQRSASSLVVVLPKWTGRSKQTREGKWVESVALLSASRVQTVLDNAIGGSRSKFRFHRSPAEDGRWVNIPVRSDMGKNWNAKIRVPQFIESHQDLKPLVWNKDGILIGRYSGWGRSNIYFVSDPDLLNNAGLHRADHPIMIHRFIIDQLGAERVVVDEVIHGYVKEVGFLAEFLHFPMVLVTLHGTFVLVLACWAGMGRTVKPRPAPSRMASGKEPMLENTARLLLFAGHGTDSVRRYLHQSLRFIGHHYSLPRDLKLADLSKRLQAISSARGLRMDLAGMERNINALPDGREARDRRILIMARTLYRWRREMTHEH
ncbi:MAG: hypothetical protein QF645_05605, partial [Planctomycetota bacterium]|nr:hypothetical protein [Planctomycetota bacterium]